ncbi:hypothetical protein pdam_00013436 [Pocillopora damicornis]|uniref:Uncharacterized protein n=1 Tax=Pocillopora damicornis TaxID=46731 RepID=A0A3M6UWT4_POCDA|nr:hypothetical protein pdam_00013436 [Pocillopora damicornis]
MNSFASLRPKSLSATITKKAIVSYLMCSDDCSYRPSYLICNPLTNLAVQFAQSYSHLADLKLADQPSDDCGSEADVLIGNDFYWSFFTEDTKRGQLGTVAMETSLGWVLSGPLPQTQVQILMFI